MSRRLFGINLALALACAYPLLAQDATDSALQGNWTVIGAQHGGKPMDGLTGGMMMVEGDRFEIHTASGNTLKGRLQVDKKAKPTGMGLVHDSGLRWDAIYEVSGDDFKINYVDAGGRDKRPTAFRTSSDTEATLVILKRTKK
jgi:uncharacterized protein (TIGR03067 family)